MFNSRLSILGTTGHVPPPIWNYASNSNQISAAMGDGWQDQLVDLVQGYLSVRKMDTTDDVARFWGKADSTNNSSLRVECVPRPVLYVSSPESCLFSRSSASVNHRQASAVKYQTRSSATHHGVSTAKSSESLFGGKSLWGSSEIQESTS